MYKILFSEKINSFISSIQNDDFKKSLFVKFKILQEYPKLYRISKTNPKFREMIFWGYLFVYKINENKKEIRFSTYKHEKQEKYY